MNTSIVILPNKIKIIKQIMAAHFARRNTKFGGGSEGGAGIHFPHTPFSSRPARAVSLAREARRQFRSKNVRAELYNSTAKRGKVWKHWLAAHGAARQAQVRNPLRF